MSTKRKNFHIQNPYVLLLIFSSLSLLCAYFVEYVMYIAPCSLCIYQRFPYLIFIMLSLISLSSTKNYIKYYFLTAIIAIILAGYHTSVERGIFAASNSCTSSFSFADNISTEDLAEMIYHGQMGMCNKPALLIFGLSMTEWNLACNIILLILFIRFKNYQGRI